MPEDHLKPQNDSTSSSSGGSGSGDAASGSGDNSGTEDYNTSAKKPSETPRTDSASTESNAEQADGLARTVDEPKAEVKQEADKSLATAFKEAREQGVLLGIKDPAALDNFTTSVANKNMRGENVDLVGEVTKCAGAMAGAVAQFKLESQLQTTVAVSDHAFVGGGVYAGKSQAAGMTLPA